MSNTVVVAATQFSCSENIEDNVSKAKKLVEDAASAGANIILLQELFQTTYFCQDPWEGYFPLAKAVEGNPLLTEFQKLAKRLHVVLPISFFERHNFDADGSYLGLYRKSHIPESPGYYEKFFFSPGDTGFRVFRTTYGVIGVAICWDQWFPECARCLSLQGAEILFYPTAIGSEPQDPSLDSRDHWRRTMQGHAAANMVPVVASNRVGVEFSRDKKSFVKFYGSSFIAGATGEILAETDRKSETYICHELRLDSIRQQRDAWGIFRDRRPDLYDILLSRDGVHLVNKKT
eukprot:jgi/Galph1/5632/GphlegSOOS_G4244.1